MAARQAASAIRRVTRSAFKDQEQRDYIRLNNERDAMRTASRYWQKVEPFQWGWERLFILRQQEADSDDAPRYQSLINATQNVEMCDENGIVRTRNYRTKKWEANAHLPLPITEAAFSAMTAWQQSHFWYQRTIRRGWSGMCWPVVTIELKKHHFMETLVRPRMVDRILLTDGDAETRYQEVMSEIDRRRLPRYGWWRGHNKRRLLDLYNPDARNGRRHRLDNDMSVRHDRGLAVVEELHQDHEARHLWAPMMTDAEYDEAVRMWQDGSLYDCWCGTCCLEREQEYDAWVDDTVGYLEHAAAAWADDTAGYLDHMEGLADWRSLDDDDDDDDKRFADGDPVQRWRR